MKCYLEVLLQLQRQFEPGATSSQQLQQVRPQAQHVVATSAHTLHVMISGEVYCIESGKKNR